MYRLLPCVADAYVTNKYIRQTVSVDSDRSTDANTGQASSVDFYKLYNETLVVSGGVATTGSIEVTRGLLKFDLSPLLPLTTSFFTPSSSFRAFIKLVDGYSGQTTPSNFTLEIAPLAKPFSEGRGTDVVGYRDKDAVNWYTASIVSGVEQLWTSGGAGYGSVVGDVSADYYTSGTLGGVVTSSLIVSQVFSRGDENLTVDVTKLVSASLTGVLPDYGFRVAFSTAEETDSKTRFVKRFYSRHTRQWLNHPKLVVQYGADVIQDSQGDAWFDSDLTINTYNVYGGSYHNFISGATPVTGSNSLLLDLVASKSITFWTSSYSYTHSASINHLTSSFQFLSFTAPASQLVVGGVPQTGVYTANINIPYNSVAVQNYVSGGSAIKFTPLWKSLDGTLLYTSGVTPIIVKKAMAGISNVAERNFVVSMPNLKNWYMSSEVAKLRVFIQNYDTQLTPLYIPTPIKSDIHQNVWWRLIHATTKQVVVPFERALNSTKLSTDGSGQWFTMYMQDLEPNQPLEFEFLIQEGGQDYFVQNQGFVFKIRSDNE